MARITQFLLVAMLGVILSVVVASSAMAEPTPSFTVSPSVEVEGEPVTLTDTSTNPDGYELSHEWYATDPSGERWIKAGNSACLTADCSRAQVVMTKPGGQVTEVIRWPGGPDNWRASNPREIHVVTSANGSAPITLASPTTVSLPATLEVLSTKPHLRIGACNQTAWMETSWQNCQPYLVGRTGPDSQGRYHYQVKLALAGSGTVELKFEAWYEYQQSVDEQTVDITVTGSAYQFGDVQSCYWPTLRNEEGLSLETKNVYSLNYYDTASSSVVLKLQVKRGRRWVTRKQQRANFLVTGEPVNIYQNVPGSSPWSRRHIEAKFGPKKYLWRKRRAIYEIRSGRKLLKRGNLSKRKCTVVP